MASKCKVHPFENGAGVCATCLRARLLALVESQNEISAAAVAGERYHQYHHHHRRRYIYDSQPLPQPSQQRLPQPLLLFPRSVSPYRRYSSADCDDATLASSCNRRRQRCRQLLFYSTPQVGPDSSAGDFETGSSNKNSFSIVKAIFGNSKSSREPDLGSLETPKRSWISSFIPRRRSSKKHSRPKEYRRPSDRGLSPAESDGAEGSGVESGYSSDSSDDGGCRIAGPTPLRRPTRANNHNRRHTREISGFTLCLSPLVRASPGHRRSHAADIGFSGDIRSGSVAPSVLGPNRSRKLTDLRRFR